MEELSKGVGPRNAEEEELFAIERFRVDVQAALYAAMKSAGIQQKELARRMNVSPAYVTQLFDSGRNLTVRTVAKVCYALNREARFRVGGQVLHWRPQQRQVIDVSEFEDAQPTQYVRAASKRFAQADNQQSWTDRQPQSIPPEGSEAA